MVNLLMSFLSIALEALFLLVFQWGIWGTALANCAAMFVCALIALAPFVRRNVQLRFTRPRMSGRTLAGIVINGAPTFLNNVAGRITSILMNVFLLRLGGATAVSTYGILMYVEDFLLPALYGLCDSLQPAVGYNYGAKNYARIWAIERRCFVTCGVLSLAVSIAILLFRESVVGIFVSARDTELIAMSVHALYLVTGAYLLRWVSLALQSLFSAIGKSMYAAVLSLSVAIVFPMLALFAFGFLGLDGLWLNMPVANLLAAILSVVLLKTQVSKSLRIGRNGE